MATSSHACATTSTMATPALATSAPDAERVYFNLPGVAIVKWDAASAAAHIEWQGWAKPAEFRAANDALVEAIKDHGAT
jgi:hypothetical protein